MSTEQNGRVRIGWDVARQLVIWVAAVLLAYGAMNVRVAVLETRVDTMRTDIAEIKADVKALLQQGRER